MLCSLTAVHSTLLSWLTRFLIAHGAEVRDKTGSRSLTRTGNHVFLEPRVSVYGRSAQEWDKLADWVVNNNLLSDDVCTVYVASTHSLDGQVRWLVQLPRIYNVLFKKNNVASFDEMLVRSLGCMLTVVTSSLLQTAAQHLLAAV